MNSLILSTKKYINVSIKLSKRDKSIYKMMKAKNEEGLLIILDDITLFIPIEHRREDKNAERQVIKRFRKIGLISRKSFGSGKYVLSEYEEHFKKNLRFSMLSTTKEEIKDKKRFSKKYYELIKPCLERNTWSELLSHNINAKFRIDGSHAKMYQIHTTEGKCKPNRGNKGYTISFPHPTVSDRKFIFQFHNNDSITLQIGTTDNPINVKENFYESLITARNILNDFLQAWNFKVPALSDWLLTISHVHRDTINKDYKKYIGGIDGIKDDYGLGINLYDHDKRPKRLRKFLRIESILTTIELNPVEAIEFFERNDPFKVMNFNPLKNV